MPDKDDRRKHGPLPDFLCVGLQKAGTSWLFDQLSAHNDVWLPPVKECHFFDYGFNFRLARRKCDRQMRRCWSDADLNDINFYRKVFFEAGSFEREKRQRRFQERRTQVTGEGFLSVCRDKDIRWYGSLFKGSGYSVTGDITPAYSTLSRAAVERISKAFPDLRIILAVRNPVDRAWSQLRMRLRKGGLSEEQLYSPTCIRELLYKDERIYMRSYPTNVYHTWASEFGEDHMHVIFFDEIDHDPESARSKVCDFLGLDSDPGKMSLPPDYDKKSATPKQQIPVEVHEELNQIFADEIQAAGKLFGGPASGWYA